LIKAGFRLSEGGKSHNWRNSIPGLDKRIETFTVANVHHSRCHCTTTEFTSRLEFEPVNGFESFRSAHWDIKKFNTALASRFENLSHSMGSEGINANREDGPSQTIALNH
jgi:hypothetical protein